MTKSLPIRRSASPSEEGYVLLAVIFLVALLTISLAVAMPKVAKEIQRDRELETMHRGKQYARAVKLYYKKFGAYPPTVDALVKTNNIRFLRKKYVDPTTGMADWKLVRFGQNKAPTAMGFFGQALSGSTIAGVGSSGGNSSTSDSSTGSSSLFASSSSTTATSSSTGLTSSSTGLSGSLSGSSSTSSSGLSGQTFGGVGIIGFSPNSPKQSILVYKTKNHYNQWEFVYDPLSDQVIQSSNTATVGQSASSLANSSSSTSTTTSTSSSSSTSTTTQQ